MSDPIKSRVHVLLAEDNPGDVFLVRRVLESSPIEFELHAVDDGEQAIRFIQSADEDTGPCPDLLLLDLNLPRKDGLEILKRLQQSPKCRSAKVIVLSSSDSPADLAEATRLGANRYFRKPASLEEFLKIGDLIMELLGQEVPRKN